MPDMVSKLSGTTKNFTAGLMSDPQKMENIISMVRTVAPLTATQTVTKINTYLPFFEKISTLLGMYSFLNKAQTFKPIESMNAKSPADMITALMKNGNIPIGKMLAQPIIANNMDKMMGTMAMNMFKNGGLNDILSSFAKNSGTGTSDNNNIDLNSLMETFMPIINSMSSGNSNKDDESETNYSHSGPRKIEFKNESYLPDDDSEDHDYKKTEEEHYSVKYDKVQNAPYDRNYKNDYTPRPIRIRQRKRR